MPKIASKLIVLFSLVFFGMVPQLAQAAASDCIQTHSDGTYHCFKAESIWTLGTNQPSYQTFNLIRPTIESQMCAPYGSAYTCYEQQEINTPPLPFSSCFSSPTCGVYTEEYDTTSNTGGRFAITYYPNGASSYGQSYWWIYHFRSCPIDTTAVYPNSTSLTLCKPQEPMKSSSTSCPDGKCLSANQLATGQSMAGDPVIISSGTKTLVDTDYAYNSSSPFVFKRYYTQPMGAFRHEYERNLSYTNTSQGEIIVLSRHNFQTIVFKKISGVWTEINSNYGTKITQVSNDFTYQNENNELEYYTNLTSSFDNFTVFNLTSIQRQGGATFTLTYDANGLLSKITDPFSNDFNITMSTTLNGCNGQSRITAITGPGNKTTSYTYNFCVLDKVTYPDTTYKSYSYGSNGVIQVKDETNTIYNATYYSNVDMHGRTRVVATDGLGSTGAVEKTTYNYGNQNQITLTDARSNSITLTTSGTTNHKITGYSSICNFCTGIQGASMSYDSNGYVSSVTDYRGYVTTYTWDSRGLMLTKTEASGNSLARTTTYTYDTNTRYPLTLTVPVSGGNRVTTYTYNTNGSIASLSIVAPKNDGTANTETRSYSFDYNVGGQLTDVFGPRYVANTFNDKTTLTYNSTGQVASITNGLNQTTTFSSFNDYGQPQTVTDAAGRVTTITYDSRGRPLTRTFKSSSSATDAETTTLTYDNAGLVTQITSPSGSYNKMYYDTAHRLTKIEEYSEATTYLGKTEFTLDNMSNITAINVYNSSNTQIRTTTATYDSKNRLYQAIGAANQTDTYTYDGNNNLTQVTDAASNNFSRTYDALNRLSTATSPDTGVTSFTYSVDNNIATVTDPKSLVTNYTYNGFGNLITIVSPDTGTSTITRDIAGNPATYTDAKGQVSTMTYDVLGRLTNVVYTNATSENVTVTYDTCSIGNVCSIVDSSGTHNRTYNGKGRIASKEYVNGLFSKTVSYTYNNAGQLTNITYPSGIVVNYSYVNNKPSAVSYTSGTTTNIATGITYEAFNPNLSSFTWGNSATFTQNFNSDGLINSITAANAYPVNKSYTYDSRLNITAITESGNTARSSTATYDSKSRITNYTYGTSGNNLTYGYNTSDDRTSKTTNGGTPEAYNYASTSHRLTSISGGATDAMTYDSNGNVLTASGKIYTYNAANRMLTSNDGTITTNYLINFMGQRTKKSNSSSTTWFIYDENDNIIAEYDANGNLTNEYVYLDNKPIALIRNSNLYYIYTDHLNTPRAITDTANNLQWTWENKEAFGNNLPVEVITGFKFNLRFPGQYFDSETNLNYNLHRDYNPNWGRYMQSDPLGLAAGINTSGYVGGNGLRASDPSGLRIFAQGGEWTFFPYLQNGQPLIGYSNDKKAKYIEGYFLTQDGGEIPVSKHLSSPISKINDYTTACHGVSFTQGRYWINNSVVPLFLQEEYLQTNSSERRVGDIGILKINNQIVHSVTVKWNNGMYAYEKNGIGPGPFLTIPINLYPGLEFYRKK